jgi:hypothetical protein
MLVLRLQNIVPLIKDNNVVIIMAMKHEASM